ncbi:MAG: NAD(P)/FAD-dependent oxidoreductase [bacterium]
MKNFDVIIIGGGAAGLMCTIEAGKRKRSVVLLEHNSSLGSKIRISGGGRCNFTNLNISADNYLSTNPHFCKSALARYTPTDFIALIEAYRIAYHERKHGQLFCDQSAQQIIDMLQRECEAANVVIQNDVRVGSVSKNQAFIIQTNKEQYSASSVVIATGGLSIPSLGASDLAFTVAEQFGLKMILPKPGLVPLISEITERDFYQALSGISIDAVVQCEGSTFRENILFTHQGLSGPAILQASSYWKKGAVIEINLLPDLDLLHLFLANFQSRKEVATLLDQVLPRRFVKEWFDRRGGSKPMFAYSKKQLEEIAHELHHWQIVPSSTEGYGKAEVTVGGIDTDELSSKTMESKNVPGLYFIGECVDVTGWLGGYNFQWAWSSGWVAGQVV